MTINLLDSCRIRNVNRLPRRTDHRRHQSTRVGTTRAGGVPGYYSVAGNTKLWMWGEVKTWFAHYDGTVDVDTDDELQAIASAFALVRHARDEAHRTLIVNRLAPACM